MEWQSYGMGALGAMLCTPNCNPATKIVPSRYRVAFCSFLEIIGSRATVQKYKMTVLRITFTLGMLMVSTTFAANHEDAGEGTYTFHIRSIMGPCHQRDMRCSLLPQRKRSVAWEQLLMSNYSKTRRTLAAVLQLRATAAIMEAHSEFFLYIFSF